jgi:hypothetical protein
MTTLSDNCAKILLVLPEVRTTTSALDAYHTDIFFKRMRSDKNTKNNLIL